MQTDSSIEIVRRMFLFINFFLILSPCNYIYYCGNNKKYKDSEGAEFAKHCTAIKNAESGKKRLLQEIEDRRNGLDPEAETDADPDDE